MNLEWINRLICLTLKSNKQNESSDSVQIYFTDPDVWVNYQRDLGVKRMNHSWAQKGLMEHDWTLSQETWLYPWLYLCSSVIWNFVFCSWSGLLEEIDEPSGSDLVLMHFCCWPAGVSKARVSLLTIVWRSEAHGNVWNHHNRWALTLWCFF